MLGGGEFIINGEERVIVSQLHRCPGIDFVEECEICYSDFHVRDDTRDEEDDFDEDDGDFDEEDDFDEDDDDFDEEDDDFDEEEDE